MKFNVYAIKDLEKGKYLQPFFEPFFISNEEVKVDFGRNLKAAESIISKFPDKFELWKLCEFYDETGHMVCGEGETHFQQFICSAVELLEEKKEDVGNTEVN